MFNPLTPCLMHHAEVTPASVHIPVKSHSPFCERRAPNFSALALKVTGRLQSHSLHRTIVIFYMGKLPFFTQESCHFPTLQMGATSWCCIRHSCRRTPSPRPKCWSGEHAPSQLCQPVGTLAT